MEIQSEHLDDGALVIRLSGRMDVPGTNAIDMQFTSLAATEKARVLVDMSDVEFIASIGMRTLITNAKAQSTRGGSFVVFGCQPMVKDALSTAGIDQIIPFFDDFDAALSH
jgi:anti-anti-sigma factor